MGGFSMTYSAEALAVLKARYLWNRENPDGMFRRVADHVAAASSLYDEDPAVAAECFFRMMSNLEFLPNSPALMNAGKPQAQMAACFVLPVEDSLAAIFETLKQAALIQQSGGGTGFSFSRLRPRGDQVASALRGAASGPVSFLKVYNAATQAVCQGAVRQGANMAVLRVDHPDIIEFINAKQQETELNYFNLSVGITDCFMDAVRNDQIFSLCNPKQGEITKRLPAREIFDLIVQRAWQNGEPGLLFLDTVNRANPVPGLGLMEATNPCAEQPLLPYESCVLGSVNLLNMLKFQGKQAEIDYAKLADTVKTAVTFLDNVLDVNRYPLEEVALVSRRTRKIGLGVMGLADLFVFLGMPYASREAVSLTASIMNFITRTAREQSACLGKKRGNFPAFDQSVYPDQGFAFLRNAALTTIAPTGTLSIIAGCSGGIEPLYALAWSRRINERVLNGISRTVDAVLTKRGLLTPEMRQRIIQHGSVEALPLPLEVRKLFATAHEIDAKWHVAHLAAAQKYTDNAVAKTVNLPEKSRPEDVARILFSAYEAGCKGITVYRNRSRSGQVINAGQTQCGFCD